MPAAFLVYLALRTSLYRSGQRRIAISLEQLAEPTGLSKSIVQRVLRVLKRRALVGATSASPTAVPEYELHRHRLKRRALEADAARAH